MKKKKSRNSFHAPGENEPELHAPHEVEPPLAWNHPCGQFAQPALPEPENVPAPQSGGGGGGGGGLLLLLLLLRQAATPMTLLAKTEAVKSCPRKLTTGVT